MIPAAHIHSIMYIPALRNAEINPFQVMEIATRARAREAAGASIIHMEIGEPDFPTPAPVLAAAKAFLDEGGVYYTSALGLPALREGIAHHYRRMCGVDVDPARIIVTAGGSAALMLVNALIVGRDVEILMTDPSYPCNRHFARVLEGRAVTIPTSFDAAYQFSAEQIIQAWGPRTRGALLASPSNPTGTMVSQEQIDNFMAKVPQNVVVVFDEAYYEFVDNPPDTLKYVREGRNVVVLRTFSKIQGLAGLRVGYGIGPVALMDVLQRTRQPFNINAIAQAGALAGLLDEEHQDKTKTLTDEGRVYLQDTFTAMGLEFVPSFANFVLVKVGDGNEVFRKMLSKGVIVRAMAAYKLPEWVRISVGTMEQNRRCIEVLKEIL